MKNQAPQLNNLHTHELESSILTCAASGVWPRQLNSTRTGKRQRLAYALLLLALFVCLGEAKVLATEGNVLVSLNRTNDHSGNFASQDPVISADGRYVAFTSAASNLVANDTNSTDDVFLRDLLTGTTMLVSVNKTGTASGNHASARARISADGRYVAFDSNATDLVGNDTGGQPSHIYLRDMQTGTTRFVDVNSAGTAQSNGYSFITALSANGRMVAFASTASNLVAAATTGTYELYVHDMQTGATVLVSINSAGTASGNGSSSGGSFSADGRYIVFQSQASDLVTSDSNNNLDVFMRDLQAGTTTLVSINSTGTNSGNLFSQLPVISANGRYVVFESNASDLISNDTNGNTKDIYRRDLQTMTTTLVSFNSANTGNSNSFSFQPDISDDGRYISFISFASDLVTNDANGQDDVFLRDMQTSTTRLVSVNSAGTNSGNNGSPTNSLYTPNLSGDGRFVAFVSDSNDLVANDTNGYRDVFLRDTQANTTKLISTNTGGVTGGNGNSGDYLPVLSADGQVVAYNSQASDIALNDGNINQDVFAWMANLPPAQLQFSVPTFFGYELNTASITVTRTVNPNTSVTVNYSTSDGTAQAGPDYTAASGTLTFAPGEVSKTFFVPTRLDSLDEPDETVNLTLSNPSSNAVLGAQSTAVLSIIDGDLPPNLIVEGVTVTEGQQGTTTNAVFKVKLTTASAFEVRVSYHTGDDTTKPGSDYVETSGQLVFSPGETLKTVAVTVNGDNVFETDEYFYLHIISPVNAYIAQAQASGIILNDDAPPSLSIEDARVTEGDAGTTNAVFMVHLNGLTEVGASVDYATSDITATAGSDYDAVSGTLNFSAGETLKTINVPVKGDTLNESNETFFVNLKQPVNATIANSQAVGAILNDDTPRLKFLAPVYGATEDVGFVTITVVLVGDTHIPVTVDYTTADGSAQQRTDYFTSSGTLSFAAGETSKTFNVLLQDDVYVEGDEGVNLSLSNPTGGAILDSAYRAGLIIHDNDTLPPTTNPIDDSQYFVRQQYLDFLNRLPDTGGLNYWTNEITRCGSDAQCIHDRRVAVADAFSFEPEFQQTGAYIYRIYKVSIGLRPTYSQFTADRGRVVSGPGLDQSKTAYALRFVQSASFKQEYANATTASQFVDLMLTVVRNYSGVDISSQRGALIALYDGTDAGKAAILRQVADNQAVIDAEYNRSFVLMEYFGFLRRDPDAGGYAFWLAQVNKFPLRDVGIQHAMVCSFITSAEYQLRFSPIITHTNTECPQ
jgi:hypothetical protein